MCNEFECLHKVWEGHLVMLLRNLCSNTESSILHHFHINQLGRLLVDMLLNLNVLHKFRKLGTRHLLQIERITECTVVHEDVSQLSTEGIWILKNTVHALLGCLLGRCFVLVLVAHRHSSRFHKEVKLFAIIQSQCIQKSVHFGICRLHHSGVRIFVVNVQSYSEESFHEFWEIETFLSILHIGTALCCCSLNNFAEQMARNQVWNNVKVLSHLKQLWNGYGTMILENSVPRGMMSRTQTQSGKE
mmetsp:Transcript_11150/g.41651  ORF Transcript_11150/g.41651 Transcript_11150/m.41651 type:complete len:245 (-) Transcript_11150:2994-3728(-)